MGMAMEWLRSWHRMEEGWECDGMAPFLAQDGGWRRDGNGDGMAPFLEQDGGRMGMAVAWLPSWHRMEGWEWLSLGRLCLLGSDGGRWRRARSQERITLAGQIGVLQINTICFSSGLETWGKCQNHIHYEEYVRALWDAFLKNRTWSKHREYQPEAAHPYCSTAGASVSYRKQSLSCPQGKKMLGKYTNATSPGLGCMRTVGSGPLQVAGLQ